MNMQSICAMAHTVPKNVAPYPTTYISTYLLTTRCQSSMKGRRYLIMTLKKNTRCFPFDTNVHFPYIFFQYKVMGADLFF